MKHWKNIAIIISAIVTVFVVLPPFVAENALVWDDWIWIFSSNEQLQDVAIQLGLWWFADVNVWIYSLKNPNLFLALLSFSSNIISVYLIGNALIRFKVFTDLQCAFWSACCIFSPYLLIRYTNSVAFYSLYFAAFICAAYIFVFSNKRLFRIASIPLFVFSFSLSSLMCGYFLIVLFSDVQFFQKILTSFYKITFGFRDNLIDLFREFKNRIAVVWKWLMLPMVFYALKLVSPYPQPKTNPYEYYNLPNLDTFYISPIKTFIVECKLILNVLLGGFSEYSSIGFLFSLSCAFAVLIVLFITSRITGLNKKSKTYGFDQNVDIKLVAPLFIFAYSLIFPYVIVGKPPILNSFIESRHFIPSAPFVFAMVILIICWFASIFEKFLSVSKFIPSFLMALFVLSSMGRSISTASIVWWDDMRADFIISKIKESDSDIKLWIFDDFSTTSLYTYWNYVYTGYLNAAFHRDGDLFGISYNEYAEWDKPVDLLTNKYYKDRYNISNFFLIDSYNYVTIKQLKTLGYNQLNLLYIKSLFANARLDMDKYLSMAISKRNSCIDEIVNLVHPEYSIDMHALNKQNTICRDYSKKMLCDAKRENRDYIVFPDKLDAAYLTQKYYQSMRDHSRLIIDPSNIPSELCLLDNGALNISK